MSREVCGLCWCPYDDDGTCGCPKFAEKTSEPLMEDVEGFLTNQELRELAKEAGIDPDDLMRDLDWPKLRRFAFLVEEAACGKAYDEGFTNGRQFEKTHSPSGTQQSAVPSNAQKEWVLVPRGPLQEARNIAMEWALKGRVPECGKFGQIAQNLDAMLTSVSKQPSPPPILVSPIVKTVVVLIASSLFCYQSPAGHFHCHPANPFFIWRENMGRSVSCPSGAVHVAYSYLRLGEFYCSACGETFDEYDSRLAREGEVEYDEDNEQSVDCCPHCGAHEDDCGPQDIQSEWAYYIEDFQSQMQKAFASLQTCDKWIGREDRALLENAFCYIGVSEYMGLVSMWVVPKDATYYSAPGFEVLRDHWIDQIGQRFYEVAHTCFGEPLKKLGHMSNGEGVYQRLIA